MKLLITFFLFLNVAAQNSLTIVSVGDAQVVKEKIGVEEPFTLDATLSAYNSSGAKIADIIRNDFRFYQNYFEVVKTSFKGQSFGSLSFSERKDKLNYAIQLAVTKAENPILSVKVFNIDKETEIATSNIDLRLDVRRVAHEASKIAYQAIVGKAPIFTDRIFFVSDNKMPNGIKELFVMDFDGANIKQLTFHKGLVISPSVSPDGTKVLYSLIDERNKGRTKNNNLMLLDLGTGQSEVISKRAGINSGAVFAEDGNSIYLTLSIHGNAEIYQMDLATKSITRLTRNFAPDVDPSINATGSLMTFLSGRPGKPMIYTMIPTSEENSVKRISYVGKYNATPRFSPDGKEIVFSSWMDERFDLYKVNSDGSALGRLTKDFGSNEDPDYSKDGQFIIFTNQRVISRKEAVQNLYIMDIEGKILGALTQNFGKCISPRWSK